MAETAVNSGNDVVLRPQFDISTVEELEERTPYIAALARMRLLWERRRFLSRVAFYFVLGSTLIAFLIPSRYDSTARLMPPDNKPSSGLALAAASMSGNSSIGAAASELLGMRTSSDVFVGILSSRTVQDKLIQKFDLRHVYWTRNMEDARKILTSRTSVSVDRKSQIIAITVSDRSPQRSAALAQAYIEELDHLVADLSTSSARRERIFIEGRLQSVTRDLEDAEKQLADFSSKNAAIDIKEQGKAMVEAAATLQGQLIASQSELEGLKQIYTDENVRVRTVQARIRELQGQLEKMGGKAEGNSSASAGSNSDGSLYPSIRKLPLLAVTFGDLYRRTKVQEAVFETLTKEYELAKVEEAKEIPTVKVLDPPDVPEKKSFPPRMVIVLFGAVLGLSVGIVFVFVHDVWQSVDSGDPGKVFAQEVFETIANKLDSARKKIGNRLVNGRVWQRIIRKRGSETELR